jgi:hypothetical protein
VDCHVTANISVNLLSNKSGSEWWGLKFEQYLTLEDEQTRQQKFQTTACNPITVTTVYVSSRHTAGSIT